LEDLSKRAVELGKWKKKKIGVLKKVGSLGIREIGAPIPSNTKGVWAALTGQKELLFLKKKLRLFYINISIWGIHN
jgi:hypothetical protein